MKTPELLTHNWPLTRFGDVVYNVNDNVRDPLSSDLERYVGLDHLDPESLHIKRWGLIADGTTFTRRFVAGQVLFGKRRAYQRKVAVAEFDGICSGDILVFEPANDQLLPELLPFIVQSDGFFQHALGTSAGSLSPRTKWQDLARYEFALPPLDEQRRIAEILWAADEALSEWLTVKVNLEQTLNALREYVICDPKFPRQRLGDCLSGMVPGKSVLGLGRPAASNEFGVLKVSAVGANGFVPDENKTLIDHDDFRPEFRVNAGDLLITRANTRELVGRACIVPQDYHQLMLCDKTIRLDVLDAVMSKVFLLEVLQSRELRLQIESAASGTAGAMKNISQAKISSFLVPVPDNETQQAIISQILSARSSLQSVAAHVEQIQSLQRNLLQHLLKASTN